jgi:hypothetical protein
MSAAVSQCHIDRRPYSNPPTLCHTWPRIWPECVLYVVSESPTASGSTRRGNSVGVLSKRRGAARRAGGSAPHPGEPFIGAHPAVQTATAERNPRIPLPVCAHVAREALRNPATRLCAPEGASDWCVCFCAYYGAFGRACVRLCASSCTLSSVVPLSGASP